MDYIDAGYAWKRRIAKEWSAKAANHMHIEGGFSLIALSGEKPVGLISVCWRILPSPLTTTYEGYIDIIEVIEDNRRRGIARRLIEKSIERARAQGAYQLRALSSEDKLEAILMWKELGFGLCPAVTYPKGEEIRGYFVTMTL